MHPLGETFIKMVLRAGAAAIVFPLLSLFLMSPPNAQSAQTRPQERPVESLQEFLENPCRCLALLVETATPKRIEPSKRAVLTRILPNSGGDPTDVVEWQTNIQEIAIEGRSFYISKMIAAGSSYLRDNRGMIFGRANNLSYQITENALLETYASPSNTFEGLTTTIDLANAYYDLAVSVVHLGLPMVECGSLVWNKKRNEFTCRRHSGSHFRGEVLTSDQLNRPLSMRLTNTNALPFRQITYAYSTNQSTSLPKWFPEFVEILRIRNDTLVLDKKYRFLSIEVSDSQIPEAHFSPKRLTSEAVSEYHLFTNNAIHSRLADGTMLKNEEWGRRNRPLATGARSYPIMLIGLVAIAVPVALYAIRSSIRSNQKP
jgi:hypothetical protein